MMPLLSSSMEQNMQHFRKVVLWLEDQKIRNYKIEERSGLRDVTSEEWPISFNKYCEDLKCPETSPLDKLEWLINLAVRLEFEDNFEKYQICPQTKEKLLQEVPVVKSSNPLDNLDFHSSAFKGGTDTIAKLLNIPGHPDHLVTLHACCKLVHKRLNPSVIANPNSIIVKGKPFPIFEVDSGTNVGDKVLANAVKCLSLLYIQDLRDLQTKINEAIVNVQSITANPKTDTRLGKVGV
ncbi:RNA transcription, translation and transport factor protein isoform X2 [Prorops nasuta]|uniref:RNA transcription, translation and transport factor protein isoform X2 n=1 Tax=Prorops nasuta TaxID=863751 RepID=UPI0034CE9353